MALLTHAGRGGRAFHPFRTGTATVRLYVGRTAGPAARIGVDIALRDPYCAAVHDFTRW
ncbi:hypothetical protein AB0D29_17145 [Streptomyces sp. NPDC048424]|uniref:hypothetical protein n=1 Tax=Streptomyces sp. NPDC048424 TaxID=3155265 RepID=UPI00344A0A62